MNNKDQLVEGTVALLSSARRISEVICAQYQHLFWQKNVELSNSEARIIEAKAVQKSLKNPFPSKTVEFSRVSIYRGSNYRGTTVYVKQFQKDDLININ